MSNQKLAWVCGAVALAIVPVALAESKSKALARKFIGTWRLVSVQGMGWGTDASDPPTGILMYDNTGRMAVQINYKSKRPAFLKGPLHGTVEEKAAAFETYTAYYGPFTIDPAAGIVVHHLESSTTPGRVGTDNVRYYEFLGNRLILSPAEDGKGGRLARKDTVRHLTWERIDPK